MEHNESNLLEVRTANQVLKDASLQPDPIFLYQPLVTQGELVILFADTGIGKTALSVQMAVHIAKQQYHVLYVDLELSDKQFEKRYRNDEGIHFRFPETFFRAGYCVLKKFPDMGYEDFFIASLKSRIEETKATVVVIDNMTKIVAGSTDTAKSTIPIMNSLSEMKFDQGLTFLILEHNKKVDEWRPISLNDLQGSKMKSNFADSVFTIGKSATDKNIRYIKQLKVRRSELEYDTDNVLVCRISKDDGYLGFRQVGFANEMELLRLPSEDLRATKVETARQLKDQGLSNVAIANELGVSEGAVRKWLKGT
mgnify:CR=1 FL=1